jgi:hypothetical protein
MLRVMQLFSHVQSQLVPIQGAQGPVSVYATQDDGHNTASLLFVNQTSHSQQISVQVKSILPANVWQGLQKWSAWHAASLTLRGYSMAVLTLHRDGSDEVFRFDNTVNAQQAVPEVQHVECGGASSC